MESYSLLVTSAIEMAVVYRSVSLCSKCFCEEISWYAELSVFHQRCPGAWSVSAHVPLREWSVGRCALCSGHWPGFWWAQGGAAGNIWAGHSSSFPVHLMSTLKNIHYLVTVELNYRLQTQFQKSFCFSFFWNNFKRNCNSFLDM